jgi:hypothetical protein
VWSLFKDLIRPKGWYVTRNSSNQKAFLLTFTTLCAAAFAFVTQVSPVPNNGKTLPIIFDFAIIAYLCFFSSWFTNRVVVVRVWFENKKW